MPRLLHGASISLDAFREARENIADASADMPLAFAAAQPTDLQDFDFLFPDLQNDPANLLPEAQATRDNLVLLGMTMRDASANDPTGDSQIPAAYTYFGQFVDHDITLETTSANLPTLISPGLTPLPLNQIRDNIRNIRSATLDLDSVYGLPAPRVGPKMAIGVVTPLNGTSKPILRPPGKGDDNDLKREPRSADPADIEHDRAALIGDPRNDENTIVAQLHLAFLKAHNEIVDMGNTFKQASRILRQHYQHIVLQDFLKRIADPQIVKDTIKKGNKVYDAMAEPFFMPLEYAVAAYRFGHSMVRRDYDFNLNFNTRGGGSIPATLDLLFTFTALSSQLGNFDTLPDNWIIEWPNLVDVGQPFSKARLIDTKLVEPLFELRTLTGEVEPGGGQPPNEGARLAVRNLLRGYLLRMPTGQAVAGALQQKLAGVREIPVLTPDQILQVAANPEQAQVLQDSGFLERTPLWFYILAEAAALGNAQHLGPAGSTIIAEVLVGLVRRSQDSILRTKKWKPSLPSSKPNKFTLTDLLKVAKVL